MLDFSALLSPISKDNPTGIDPRQDSSFNSLYHQIKDKRSNARLIERKNMQQSADETQTKSIWTSVSELSIKLLTTSSKDIEVTAWLIEAQLRLNGFAGLGEGFHFLNALIEQYWDTLFPLLDSDGVEARLASLSGLNGDVSEGTLIVPINSVLLTQGQAPGPFAAWQYKQALETSKVGKIDPAHATAHVTVEQIMTAAAQTSIEFFRKLLNDLQTCIDEFNKLTDTLVKKCGVNDAPPSSAIQNALSNCLDYLRLFSKDKLTTVTPTKLDTTNNSSNSLQDINPENVMNREHALAILLTIGDFFRKTEPHSPLSYIIEKTHRWGTMSLPQLYKELITDNQVLLQLSRLTGVELEDKK